MGKELNKDQEAALNVMLRGGNCFLTGEAGTQCKGHIYRRSPSIPMQDYKQEGD